MAHRGVPPLAGRCRCGAVTAVSASSVAVTAALLTIAAAVRHRTTALAAVRECPLL